MEHHIALITGASRGLGLEIARLFAGEGVSLILTARGAEALRAAESELQTRTEVLALPGDVADPAHAEQLVKLGTERFGRIDWLINNASTIGPSPMPALDTYPGELLADVFRVNVLAPLHLIQLILPQMKARRYGVIVNVSSDAAVQAYPTWGGYGASKAALEHLSRVLAAELEGTSILIYIIDPGDMNTQMHREAEPGVDLSHLPGPEVPAPAFLRLLDDPAPFARIEAQKLVAEYALGARPLASAPGQTTNGEYQL
jgi:NAD(P)-dependent dehydrogenase (short-subunit alcohol dehydrogenase family)